MQLVSNWDFLTMNIIGQQIQKIQIPGPRLRVYAQLIAIQGCNNTQLNNSQSQGVSFRFGTKALLQKQERDG